MRNHRPERRLVVALVVDKPLVCQRGLPGRLSTHRPALTLARCSVAAHCASLRVLATSALRASDGQRPGRECIFTFRTALALRRRGVPCLRTSCARHFSPSGLHLFASICSAKNARNDVHAVISDLSLVLPILCQCSELGKIVFTQFSLLPQMPLCRPLNFALPNPKRRNLAPRLFS